MVALHDFKDNPTPYRALLCNQGNVSNHYSVVKSIVGKLNVASGRINEAKAEARALAKAAKVRDQKENNHS